MATHDVDQKILGHLAEQSQKSNKPLAAALFKILGLSVLLARRLIRARKLRRDPPSDSAKTETLHHHIIWLAREGLQVTEIFILPHTTDLQHGPLLKVFSAKLRASFYHVFALFHNSPPVRLMSPTLSASPVPASAEKTSSPLSLSQGNGQRKSPAETRTTAAKQSPEESKENPPQAREREGKDGRRDPIFSMISDSSAVTNPWANINVVSPPPGFGGTAQTQVSNPAAFLLPSVDYLPSTTAAFREAASLAKSLLPGSSPLRLSVSLEQCAYFWDCLHDRKACRKLAAQTIKQVYDAQEPMNDVDFEDAAVLVGTLGRMMKRKSFEGTPRLAVGSPANPATTGDIRTPSPATRLDVPPVPRITHSPASSMTIPRRPVGTPPGVRSKSKSPSSIPRPIRSSGNGNGGSKPKSA